MTKIYKALAVLTLAVSAFLIFGAWTTKLPEGTYIDGTHVGGMSRTAAVAAVREQKTACLKDKELIIYAGGRTYTFIYPEFNFTDDLPSVAGSVRRRGEYFSNTRVYLNGAESIAENICAALGCQPKEPCAIFNKTGAPFTYCEGSDGAVVNRTALLEDISRSLNGGFEGVTVRVEAIPRKKSMEVVKRETSLLCSFTTYFDSSNHTRSSNIALACSKINGYVLPAGETFSFNGVVGPRTAANGFKPAKIISGGQFVEGVGGGVCQVSTTLYNAVLLSGLDVTEYHPHSLRVSYVAPSRDAMVSGTYFDLKFKNTRRTPVYVRMNASEGAVTCSVYGLSDGVKRTFVSRTTGTIPQPDDIVEEGEEGIVSRGCGGTISEGYLVEEYNGVRTERLIRRDRYAAAPTVRRQPSAPQPADGTEPSEEDDIEP